MSTYKTSVFLLLNHFMVFGYAQLLKLAPVVVEGRIVSGNDDTPIANAHVFVVLGEEEAISNNKGEFSIRSWQQLPFTVTVEKRNYETVRFSVSDPARKQLIRLKPKL